MIKISYLPMILLIACGKPITESNGKGKEMNALGVPVTENRWLDLQMYENFNLLPLKGNVYDKKRFWSGDSWRLKNGSINYRWNASVKEGRQTISPRPRDLINMSVEQLKELSPSEKYDLFQGHYDYPLKQEVERNLPEHPEDWEGLCHGWAAASLHHNEPRPRIMRNPDGLKIPFGSTDIKALLTYYYAQQFVPDNNQYGKRCEQAPLISNESCDEDVSALAFHTILTNTLGLRGISIIVDIERYQEVWNHPILSFESTIKEDKRTRSERQLLIETVLKYTEVVEKGSWNPTNGTFSHMISQYVLLYQLTLDHNGNMIAGQWRSPHRPDFIWRSSKIKQFEGSLAALNELIE